jgi:hypothetical protein
MIKSWNGTKGPTLRSFAAARSAKDEKCLKVTHDKGQFYGAQEKNQVSLV